MRTLYLCYFGLREPLVQAQVLPYLRQLSSGGIEVHLLTFEPGGQAWPAGERENCRARLEAEGIHWHSLPYHKRPSLPATLYDVAAGAWHAARLARRHGIEVLHARTHVPLAMGLLAQRWTGCRLVFDVRGLLADEYAEAGIWTEGSPVFRAVKWLERTGLKHADQVVVLTRRMREWLLAHRLASADQIEVIPCCADFARFSAVEETTSASDNPNHNQDRFELVYAGSVTGLYLLEEMARFFLALRAQQPDAFLRVLTAAPATEAAARLRRVGLDESDFWIGKLPPAEVPRYLRRARLGLSFRKPAFSQIAASPTKVPEYLAAGLPVICNAGIGDMDELITCARVGVVVQAFDDDALRASAGQALKLLADPDLTRRCVRVAREHFDLASVGGERYRRLYQRLQQQLAAAT